jgi:hypothetical protein
MAVVIDEERLRGKAAVLRKSGGDGGDGGDGGGARVFGSHDSRDGNTTGPVVRRHGNRVNSGGVQHRPILCLKFSRTLSRPRRLSIRAPDCQSSENGEGYRAALKTPPHLPKHLPLNLTPRRRRIELRMPLIKRIAQRYGKL